MSNSVTVPSDSTLSLTVTCKTLPSAISLVGWFQAAWNLFVSIPTYPANAESPDPLPSAFPGPDPPPLRECGPGPVEACPCNCLPLFFPAPACGRFGSGEALGFSFFFSDFTGLDLGFGEASLFAFSLFSSSSFSFSFCFSFFSFTSSSFLGEGFGVAECAGDDLGVGFGVGLGDGLGVAFGVGLGVGFGVGFGDGSGVGSTVGRGVGVAAGVTVVLGVEIGSSDCCGIGGGVAATGGGVGCSS